MVYENVIKEFIQNACNLEETAHIEVEIILKNYVYDENDHINIRVVQDGVEKHTYLLPIRKNKEV